jgi:hypothetical protein
MDAIPTRAGEGSELITCPFCGETGFDAPGLKSHLQHGDCEAFNDTEGLPRLFVAGSPEKGSPGFFFAADRGAE